MPTSMMLVFSKSTSPETEAAYNRWYSEQHIQDVAKVAGVISATRYRLEKGVPLLPGISGDHRGHLAIYELEGRTPEELNAFADALRQALASGAADIDPTLDMVDISASLAVPITPRVTA